MTPPTRHPDTVSWSRSRSALNAGGDEAEANQEEVSASASADPAAGQLGGWKLRKIGFQMLE
jgi:hypothetical protein